MASLDKSALVILAEGAEEMEVTIVVDVLRRAGVQVTLAGLAGDGAVTCSRNLRLLPDCALSSVVERVNRREFDVLVLPGGLGGSERLAASALVGQLLRTQAEAGATVAAICAAPIALAAHGLARGERITSHPSVRGRLAADYDVVDEVVVESGQWVTSRGPGTAFDFALALVARLGGSALADQVRAPMVFSS